MCIRRRRRSSGPVAQLDRVLASEARGRAFESRRDRKKAPDSAEEISASRAPSLSASQRGASLGPREAARLALVHGGVLTVRDVAHVLQVSTATVYAMVDAGELPSFRVLNSIRVRRDDLDAFISGRRS